MDRCLGDYKTIEKRKVKIGTQNWETVLDRRQLANNIWNRQAETLCTLITLWAGERKCNFTDCLAIGHDITFYILCVYLSVDKINCLINNKILTVQT